MKPEIEKRTSKQSYIKSLLDNTGMSANEIARKVGVAALTLQSWPDKTDMVKSKEYYPLQYCVESLASCGVTSFGVVPDVAKKEQNESYLSALLLRSGISLDQAGELVGRTKDYLIRNFTSAKYFNYPIQFLLECLAISHIQSGETIQLTQSDSRAGVSALRLMPDKLEITFSDRDNKASNCSLPGDFFSLSKDFEQLVAVADYAVCFHRATTQLKAFFQSLDVEDGVAGAKRNDGLFGWDFRKLDRATDSEEGEVLIYYTHADLEAIKKDNELSVNLSLFCQKMASEHVSVLSRKA